MTNGRNDTTEGTTAKRYLDSCANVCLPVDPCIDVVYIAPDSQTYIKPGVDEKQTVEIERILKIN